MRILTLDGSVIFFGLDYMLWLIGFSGGMRGILELEILRAIKRALGGGIPIQAFFDLIVGTRYGSTR